MQVNEKWLEAHGLTQADIDEGRAYAPVMGGIFDSTRRANTGTPPPPPPAPDPLDSQMDAFRQLLDELNPRFRDVSDELRGIAGGEDPRFEAFRQMTLGDISSQNASFFGRRGTGGSTAALNQLQRSTLGANTQIGMAQMGRQDTARLQSLDVLRGFLENETVPIQLMLQKMAAENAATAANMAGQQDDSGLLSGALDRLGL